MAQDREKSPAPEAIGPELRLVDRRALVGFPPLAVAPGLTINDFALQIPDVTFPFNLTGGAARYQKKRLHFGFLELQVDAELVARKMAELAGRLLEVEELKLHFRPGYLEGQARLSAGERAAFTFKVAFDGDGEKLAIYLYDVRLYGFASKPAPQIAVALTRGVEDLGLLPGVERRGASGFTTRVLPPLVQVAAVSRGYKVPSLDQARLSAAEVSSQGLRLRFSSGGLPPPATPDEELLLALEGARAFADAEGLIAEGKLAEARAAYLKLGDAHEAHPFAAERLLSLLVADPQAHEMALDLAASIASRRERSATALWAEAVVRERRGEHARASERYLALCALARKAQEEASAFFAAESAARASHDHAPQMAVKALHELLGLKPDHLPSLKQLARAADQANDRAGAIRAYRRIAALARDPGDAAEAHVQMARLCAVTEDDIAGARLHCEAALKLQPDHPEALYLLGDLCHRAGEHLRALKALDRLREVGLGRHELDRVGRANLLAGKVWEAGLKQPENALLRYREAVSLMPGQPEPLFYAARAAEGLGHLQEAVAGYQQTIELAGPAPRTDEIRVVAHQAHHAMARLCRTRLGDPARAHEHLQSALGLDPRDMVAIEELLPYFRASGRSAELADALEKAAAVTEAPERRAAFWAEAGELFRGRLSKPEKAERLLASALEADGHNRVALEGMLALAESRRDGGQLCRCLKSLAELAEDPRERARYFRRLAVAARDLAFDLDLAAYALTEVIKLEPDDLPTLGELSGLQRRRADMNGLAQALEMRARSAEAQNDKRLASAALRELAQVLEARLGRVGEALIALEKAARIAPEASVLLELADLSLRCERPMHARRALEDLLQTQPVNAAPERLAEIRARLGRACEMLGDTDAAKKYYAEAFPLRRLDEQLGQHLEALYQQAGQNRELADLWSARAQALLAAERAPEAGPLFLKAGKAFLALGDKQAAVLRLTAALDASAEDAQSADALDALAQLEMERGAKVEAAKLFSRKAALTVDPRAAARLYFRAATLAIGTPREPELLAQALSKDEGLAPARLRRAELLVETEPARALADMEAVLELPESDPEAPAEAERLEWNRRAGMVALKAGRGDAARRHLAFYVAHKPDDVEVHRELVTLHRRAGAKEPLADLLTELAPRLSGDQQRSALRELAELSLALGRREAAVDALRDLVSADPADRNAARTLLDLLPEERDADERAALVSSLLDGASPEERTELLIRRSQLHRKAGRLERARDDLAEATRSAKQPGALLRELAELARATGDERSELEAWRTAAEKDPSLASDAAPRLVELARGRLAVRDAAAAKAGFTAALQGLPRAELHQAYLGLADAYLMLDESAGAAAALLEASKEGPPKRRAEALLRRAELLEQSGDTSGASEAYAASLAAVPRDEKATAGLKRTLQAQEDWEALAEVLADEASVASKTAAAPLYAELGELYLRRLDLKGPAEAALRRAAQLDKANVSVRRALVGLLAERGELPEMGELAEQASEVLPKEEGATLLRDAAQAARAKQDLELALRLLRRANALAPAEGEALEQLSELLYLRGAQEEALAATRALAKKVDFAEAPERAEAVMMRLADLAEHAGDAKLAEKSLRRVVQERPLNLAAAQRLSGLLARTDPRESVNVLWTHAQQRGPSDETVSLLVALAERARTELADVELSSTILKRATEVAPEPMSLHRSLADLYREAGRTQDLAAELQLIAEKSMEDGDVDAALDAYGEQADLVERAGRVDDALKTLATLRELCEDQEEPVRAAAFERRRAELLRDAKLDLNAASSALEKSFELHKSLETARAGVSLARRRNDADSEADWLERTVDLVVAPKEKARILLELAALFEGPLGAPRQAEAALLEAARMDPALEEAEQRLVALLEREGRPNELAAHYEESAQKATDPAVRAQLLLRAARLYRDRANRPDAAAAALLAARAAAPDDVELTAQCADLLFQMGRQQEAAEFDALLLETDPFRARVFERHAAFLKEAGDEQALAALMLRRAEKQQGEEAAESYLEAARAFRRAGGEERAHICEESAFEASPRNDEAFEALRAHRQGDARRLAELLERRAEAVPAEAVPRLRERANLLLKAGETLLAAEAFDALLAAAPADVLALSARAELAAEAGGPLAAQPYDRRLVATATESTPVGTRSRSYLRLGHAALNASAYRDAADALEAVVSLEPSSERGQEALSLLAEVHARTQNADGLFKTSLALAARARPDEAEALLRRAASLYEDPRRALDALMPLAKLRPADRVIVERTAQGLRGEGRFAELAELFGRSADAVGGPTAAEWLLEAARITSESLKDDAAALALQKRAEQMDPHNVAALRAVAGDQRKRSDLAALQSTLERLVQFTSDADEASQARVELAELLEHDGKDAQARSLLDAVVQRGPAGAGYAQALEALVPLLQRAGDDAGLAQTFASRAELAAEGNPRAELLLNAARHYERAGQDGRAVSMARASVASQPSAEGLVLLARIWRRQGQAAKAAPALVQAAQLSPVEARGPMLVEAAEAWEAAGDVSEARDVVERLAAEHPGLLPPEDLARRLGRLGSAALAMKTGFGPAMDAGDFQGALKLAEEAKDRPRQREALWALVSAGADASLAGRLAELLRGDDDAPSLIKLAHLLERAGAPAVAVSIYEGLAFGEASSLQAEAMARLLLLAESDEIVARAVEALSPDSPRELIDLVVEKARALAPEARTPALEKAAELLPERRAALLRDIADLHLAARRPSEAAQALERMAPLEPEAGARAALQLELGELYLRKVEDPERARQAFERALADDPQSLPAAQHLLSLYRVSEGPDRFIDVAERVVSRLGQAALGDRLEMLADAYEAKGRNQDAQNTLGLLPETPERLRRRARLAQALGYPGEALQLRERVAEGRAELEEILVGYLKANLVPFALRLTERLLAEGPLPRETTRLAAERLADSVEGPQMATRLWPILLEEEVADADGWTLYAEALRRLDRKDAAAMADGFGAALTASTQAAPPAPVAPADWGTEDAESGAYPDTLPPGCVAVSASGMPRLHAALSAALTGLGAHRVRIFLHPGGGVEAWLARPDELVLGAGALGAFGPVELTYLCALALALGPRGHLLTQPGEVDGFDDAARDAFSASPASLAASRVLAQLAPAVRGGDPTAVDSAQILKGSSAFRAIALRALELLRP